jgi:hypothetical protein
MWLKDFKVALATKDVEQLEKLIQEMPHFTNVEEMQEALFLIDGARIYIKELRDEALHEMQTIKQKIKFVQAAYI